VAGDLLSQIERIAADAGASAFALSLHDYARDLSVSHRGDEWFHAASTIKVPILFGVFAAAEQGDLSLDGHVHVRNRFLSIVDSSLYRVAGDRDAGREVQARIGSTMRVRELARDMITQSSNLATNLLVDLVGADRLASHVQSMVGDGIELRRGVEDEKAHAQGLNNRVTASGLVRLLRAIQEEVLSPDSSREMLDILHAQAFRSGIPAGVPDTARVANKTGEISTVAHDVGLVFPEGRAPYALAILTGWDPDRNAGRRETLAALSRAVYRHLVERDR